MPTNRELASERASADLRREKANAKKGQRSDRFLILGDLKFPPSKPPSQQQQQLELQLIWRHSPPIETQGGLLDNNTHTHTHLLIPPVPPSVASWETFSTVSLSIKWLEMMEAALFRVKPFDSVPFRF